MINISEPAQSFLKDVVGQNKNETQVDGFRLFLSKRGCSGFEYVVELAEGARPGELTFSYDGFTLYVTDADFKKYFAGLMIDIEQDEFETGLVFKNPNERGGCGCGESVSFD